VSGAFGGSHACPCGSGAPYAACCGPVHDGARAPTAQALVRSRYAAYAIGRLDHVFRTWHPRTRPDDLEPTPAITWTGLTILSTADGGPGDATGRVEFEARYETPEGAGVLHEDSRFERRAGRWVYVDGVVA
jgi:SEC-C motif-containing protein